MFYLLDAPCVLSHKNPKQKIARPRAEENCPSTRSSLLDTSVGNASFGERCCKRCKLQKLASTAEQSEQDFVRIAWAHGYFVSEFCFKEGTRYAPIA